MSQRSDVRCKVCAQFLCLSGELPDWEWWLMQDDGPNVLDECFVPVCEGCYERSSAQAEDGEERESP